MKHHLFRAIGTAACLFILAQATAQTLTITGPGTVETGVSNDFTCTVTNIPAGYVIQKYTWSALVGPAGPSGLVGSINNVNNPGDVVIATDATSNTVPIKWGDFFNQPNDVVMVVVYLKDDNNNERSPSQPKSVTVRRISNSLGITGPNPLNKCCTSNQNYCVTAFGDGVNTTGYTFSWTWPAGWTPVGATTGSCITLTPNVSGGGQVTCTVRRSQAPTAYSRMAGITITRPDPTIGAITGQTALICREQNYVYSITQGCPAGTPNWTVPSGWSIVSGQGSNSITARPSATGISGNVGVSINYAGGTCSASKTLAVNVLTAAAAAPTFEPSYEDGYTYFHCNKWYICPRGGYMHAQVPAGTQTITWTISSPWFFWLPNNTQVQSYTETINTVSGGGLLHPQDDDQ